MTIWDVFHSDRLEVERGLDSTSVKVALARGALTEDDLIRPSASGQPWERIGDRLDLLEDAEPVAAAPPPPAAPAPSVDEPHLEDDEDELEILSDAELETTSPPPEEILEEEEESDSDDELEILEETGDESLAAILPSGDSIPAVPVIGPGPSPWEEAEYDIFDDENEYDPLDEDEAAAEFTLARGSAETVEELDLAAMVDVAFQLVLFFLVTATTVLYKSLEVPKPNSDAPPEAAAQGRSKTLDELKADYILVEMDTSGTVRIDRQPFPGALTMMNLAEKLRTLRTDTGRSAMLFSADYTTPHAKAVIAYDAANEIGLQIKIAKPSGGLANVAPPAVIKKN